MRLQSGTTQKLKELKKAQRNRAHLQLTNEQRNTQRRPFLSLSPELRLP